MNLKMINIEALLDPTNPLNPPTPASKTKGPVLLMHGARTNLFSFYAQTDVLQLPLPSSLVLEGYDVWLAVRRGGLYQKSHLIYTDPDGADLADFWNFDTQTIGVLDIERLVQGIIADRTSTGKNCSKVSIVAHSLGTLEAMTAINSSNAGDYVDRLINLAPCAAARREWLPQPPEDARRRRQLLDADQWADYKMEAKEVKKVLDNREDGGPTYNEFYNALRAAQMDDLSAWNADWYPIFFAVLEDYLPADSDYFDNLDPNPLVDFWSAFVDLLSQNGTYASLYGPDWDNQRNAVCAAIGSTSSACLELLASPSCYTDFPVCK